jgi:hypothetical protein
VFASGFFRDWDSADPADDIVRRCIQSAEPPELGALASHFCECGPPFNATLTDAFAINSAGSIVGLYIDAAGTLHGYLALPHKHDE